MRSSGTRSLLGVTVLGGTVCADELARRQPDRIRRALQQCGSRGCRPDATIESSEEAESSLLVSWELAFPPPPVDITPDRAVLSPGDRLKLPDEPQMFVFATVERGDAYLLSGQGFNRGEDPVEAYILTVSPA